MSRPGIHGEAPDHAAPWRDLREWIDRARELGELRDVAGVDWQAGIGQVAELVDHTAGSPAVLFDHVPGYPAGRRVLVNANGTLARQALTFGLHQAEATHAGLMRYWAARLADFEPIEPVEVPTGPVLENVLEGDRVDLEAFPVPRWHPGDGGRYIGTASMNIVVDPDTGRVNAGTYRNQVFGPATMGMSVGLGKRGRVIRDKYFERGLPCPVVVVVGSDPLLFLATAAGFPAGMNAFAWAGRVRGRPVEVVRGAHTGLPFPATAEIVIEGWLAPDSQHEEGPFGEFHGYYGRVEPTSPIIEVAAIYHRDDPILLGCPQGKPPHDESQALAFLRAAQIQREMAAAGVPGVTGVWCPPEYAEGLMTVVAVQQAYPGHATQALLVAGQVGAAAYLNRLVVVVDPDVDITRLDDVLWAILTRSDPARDLTITRRGLSGPLDTAVHPEARGMNSRMLIDATRPWEWRARFAEQVVTEAASRATRERWGWILEGR